MAWRAGSIGSWTRRVLKKASGPTKSASGCSRASVAKAASISRLVLAFSTWICSASLCAAVCTSPQHRFAARGVGGVEQHGDARGRWQKLAKQRQLAPSDTPDEREAA